MLQKSRVLRAVLWVYLICLIGWAYWAEVHQDEGYRSEVYDLVIPETVYVDEPFTIQATVRNTGRKTWREDRNFRLCIWINDADSGYRGFLESHQKVRRNEEVTFRVDNIILEQPGTYKIDVQMVEESVQYFGSRIGNEVECE